MKIIIETTKHSEQRYPTCGDWYYTSDGALHIKVSRLHDPRNEAALIVHELVEALCCRFEGVSQEAVDKFDFAFENNTANRTTPGGDEPGDEPDAPYARQHCFATAIERLLAERWGLNWKEKEAELYRLPYPAHGRNA